MAVSKWLMRKSFDEAAAKAEQIKIATKLKEGKNAGLFTPTQEKLRQELGLHQRQLSTLNAHCDYCKCESNFVVTKPSRARIRIKLKQG